MIVISNNSSIELQYHLDELLYWSQDLLFSSSLSGVFRGWQSLWENKSCSNDSSIPSNLLQSLEFCDRDSFPNIHQLLLIACTLPITSAEAERSFSHLRRMRSYTRSTITEQNFSDLIIITMHYSIRLDTDEVCHAFIQSHPRRLYHASLFTD